LSASDSSAVDAAPFALSPRGGDGRTAALCLHGLTGTPYEVRPVAEALAQAGIRAHGPALPGHGETPEALRRVDHGQWLEAARDEVARLRKDHERVCIAGVSMGGIVSLQLASEGLVDALAVIGAPLQLQGGWTLRLLPLVMHFHRYFPKREGSDIQEPGARDRHPGYDRIPLRSVHELMKLQREVVPRLHRITAPILVAHGAFDSTASLQDAHRIAAEVSSDDRRLLVGERSGHVVTVDYDGPRVARAIVELFSAAG
jgi:carboxylesterase